MRQNEIKALITTLACRNANIPNVQQIFLAPRHYFTRL